MRARVLLLLTWLLGGCTTPARVSGAVVGGYARTLGEELAPNESRAGGGAGLGTAVAQWSNGVGLGLDFGYQSYKDERFELSAPTCEVGCPYERRETRKRYAALELGPVLRWAQPEGRWRPSVQVGVGYARSDVNDSFRDDLPGAGAHLAVGLEWWLHPRFALRAELRESAVGYISTDYSHGALWTSALVGVGF